VRLSHCGAKRRGRGKPLITSAAGNVPDQRNNFRLIHEADSLFPACNDRLQQLVRFVRKTRGTSIVANDVIWDA